MAVILEDIYRLDVEVGSDEEIIKLIGDVERLKKELDGLGKFKGPNSDKVSQLAREEKKLEAALSQQVKTMDGLARKEKVLEANRGRLAKGTAIYEKNESRLRVVQAQRKRTVDALGKSEKRLGEQAKKTGDALKKQGTQLTSFQKTLSSGIKALQGYFAVSIITDWGKEFFDTAQQIQGTLGKTERVFGEFTGKVQDYAKQNANDIGLTALEFEALAAQTQDLLVPIGFDRGDATDITLQLQGLSGALAEWSNGQVDASQTSEILTKALLGEREQLKTLGIAINEADVKQRLLDKGQSKLTGNAEKQARAIATLELIYEKSTDAQEAFRTGGESLERQSARNAARMRELGESISKLLTPAFAAALGLADSLLTRLKGFEGLTIDDNNSALKQAENLKKIREQLPDLIAQYETLSQKTTKTTEEQKQLDKVIGQISQRVPTVEITQRGDLGNLAIDIASVNTELEKLERANLDNLNSSVNDLQIAFSESLNKLKENEAQFQEIEKRANRTTFQKIFSFDFDEIPDSFLDDYFGAFSGGDGVSISELFEAPDFETYAKSVGKIRGEISNTSNQIKDELSEIVAQLLKSGVELTEDQKRFIRVIATDAENGKGKNAFDLLGSSASDSQDFVEGSLRFFRNEVSKLEQQLQNTNLEEEKAINIAKNLEIATKQLTEAEEKYRKLKGETKIQTLDLRIEKTKQEREELVRLLGTAEGLEEISKKYEVEIDIAQETALEKITEFDAQISELENKKIEVELSILQQGELNLETLPRIIEIQTEKLKDLTLTEEQRGAITNQLSAYQRELNRQQQEYNEQLERTKILSSDIEKLQGRQVTGTFSLISEDGFTKSDVDNAIASIENQIKEIRFTGDASLDVEARLKKEQFEKEVENLKQLAQRVFGEVEIPIKPSIDYEGIEPLNSKTGAAGIQKFFQDIVDSELFEIVEQIDDVARSIKNVYATLEEGQKERIAAQERTVDKITQIADEGNAELLESEQDKLLKLEEERRKSVQRQRALDLIAAASNIVVAVSKTAAESGVLSPAFIATTLAAIGAGISAGLSITSSIPGAAVGEENINAPGTETSDSALRRVSKGERIVTAKANREYWDTLHAIHTGKVPADIINDFVKLGSWKQKPAKEAVPAQASNQSFVEKILERVVSREVLEQKEVKQLLNSESVKNTLLSSLYDRSLREEKSDVSSISQVVNYKDIKEKIESHVQSLLRDRVSKEVQTSRGQISNNYFYDGSPVVSPAPAVQSAAKSATEAFAQYWSQNVQGIGQQQLQTNQFISIAAPAAMNPPSIDTSKLEKKFDRLANEMQRMRSEMSNLHQQIPKTNVRVNMDKKGVAAMVQQEVQKQINIERRAK